jgi:hypothetical protein
MTKPRAAAKGNILKMADLTGQPFSFYAITNA